MRTFFPRLKGNSRGCLAFEPLFLIPYSMFATYATIYMHELGLSETQIGWVTTLTLVVQVFSSFISGYLTDRMGRKAALLTFDLLSWSVGTLLWAVSQNIWFFIAAALINGFQRVPHTAFYCLLVEDTEPRERTYVFTLLQVIGVVGGLFAPLGGLIVHEYGMVTGVRIMYVLAFVFMTAQFLGRHYTTHETEMGLRKKREARELGLRASLQDYMTTMRAVLADRGLLLMFGVYILFNFQMTIKGTYLSLYLADGLGMDEGLISLVPAGSSVVMLLVLWLVMPRIPERLTNRTMLWGFVLSAVSNGMLALAPAGAMGWIAASTVLSAGATMITAPYLEAAVANAIDDERRAKMFAILSVLVLLAVSPSGIIGGWAYTLAPELPIWLATGAFVLSIPLLVAGAKRAVR
ncbi:MFS family permease [Paenibacillus phyllosphaerae]|uniref:MFS family permease n=1 Tax=Paenibacillus phyllosphaerae TaxID=274593 RepID=A0A7W5B2Z6_9BACL|nr:MFS transporter [Paenibacillus phyllosphaerae]MBB3113214.1 MFS family permease [Paenibacillus phyllosphaerae]